jgi:hypothetical protein
MITLKDILFFPFSNNFNTESFDLFIHTAERRALGGIQEAKDPFLLDLANPIRHNHDEISKVILEKISGIIYIVAAGIRARETKPLVEEKKIKRLLLTIFMIFLSLQPGCFRGKRGSTECPGEIPHTRLLQVQPIYQAAFNSGPAALTMVLRYLGRRVTLEKVTADLAGKSTAELHPTTLRQYVSPIYPSSRMGKSDLCDVTEAIAAGSPVILLLALGDSSLSFLRYVVAVGYDFEKQLLVFHSGYSEYVKAPFILINEKWEIAGSLALFID